MTDKKIRGYALTVGAAILWGISGTVAQFLFEEREVDAEWLVTIRLLVAGVALLAFARFAQGENILRVWQSRAWTLKLISFGCFGMLAVQYTYFAAIKFSNAATATVLQYLGPVLIAAYYAWIEKRIPKLVELLAILLAVLGTFLLVTHGNVSTLVISGQALAWGLASAVALASYSLQPISLLKTFASSVVVGWGMVIGGVAMSFIHPPWQISGIWDASSYLATAFIILFGSLIAFYAYLSSIKMIGAATASLLSCAEPLSAAFVAVVWLKVSFGGYDWLGTAFIIATILILSIKDLKRT